MDDFSIPGASNYFGYPPSPNNYIEPGKRPLSSMSPTFVVKNGLLYAALGGSGGSKIPTSTCQVLLNVLAHNMDAGTAVGAPRVHDQLLPDLLYVETQYPARITSELSQMGYNISQVDVTAVIQLIIRNVTADGSVTLNAASDWRKYGEPAGSDSTNEFSSRPYGISSL